MQPTGSSDVISGVEVEEISVDIRVKFVDSKANYSGVMRPAHFVIDNNHNEQHRSRPTESWQWAEFGGLLKDAALLSE